MSTAKKMMLVFRLPMVAGAVRLLLTVIYLAYNPMQLPFRFIQIIPMVVLIINLFAYRKLFSDGDPVITLLLPTIIHFVLVVLLTKTVVIVPFVPLFAIDLVYLVVKGVKASRFPFVMEEEHDVLSEFSEAEMEI